MPQLYSERLHNFPSLTTLLYPYIICITKERLYLVTGTDVINICVYVKKDSRFYCQYNMTRYLLQVFLKNLIVKHQETSVCAMKTKHNKQLN